MKLKRLAIAFFSSVSVMNSGCVDQCRECDVLPEGADVFVSEWNWDYTIQTSELKVGTVIYTHRDTITPDSVDNQVSIVISADGGYCWKIGGLKESRCIDLEDFYRREPSSFVCEDILVFTTTCESDDFRVACYVDCDSTDSMRGGSMPYSLASSHLPMAELLEGYELVGFSNRYVRAQ